MKVITKEVIVTILIGIVFDNQKTRSGLEIDEGTSSLPSGYIVFPSSRDCHGWNDRPSDVPAKERSETTKPCPEYDIIGLTYTCPPPHRSDRTRPLLNFSERERQTPGGDSKSQSQSL